MEAAFDEDTPRVVDDESVTWTAPTEVPQDAAAEPEDEPAEADMPVSDVMALLQAMREEQLDTLKAIADGVQQIQSQVLVLSETAASSEEKATLCLDRLAGVERRIGSIPVPIEPPARISQQQQQAIRDGGGVRGTISSRVPAFASVPSPPALAVQSSPPPRASAPVPAWLDRRSEPGPAQPHFMRTGSPQVRTMGATASPIASLSAPVAAPIAAAVAPVEAVPMSAEEAAKEAKRRAFAADRAKMQERIAARRGGGDGAASASASKATPSAPSRRPSTEATQETVRNQPRGEVAGAVPSASRQNPSPFVGAGPGNPSGNAARFASGGNSFMAGVGGSEEEEAARQERARQEAQRIESERRAQAEREEQRRRAEEERLQKEREEARRRREEEEARRAKEAEEARIREQERRIAEAKRQAKTRHIMSSLFDKEQPDDGSSLFGGLGAALPAGSSVFDDSDAFGSRATFGGAGIGVEGDISPPLYGQQPGDSGAYMRGNDGGSASAGLDDDLVGGTKLDAKVVSWSVAAPAASLISMDDHAEMTPAVPAVGGESLFAGVDDVDSSGKNDAEGDLLGGGDPRPSTATRKTTSIFGGDDFGGGTGGSGSGLFDRDVDFSASTSSRGNNISQSDPSGGLFDNDDINDHRNNDRSLLGSTDDFLASLDTSDRVAAAAPVPGSAAGSKVRGYLFEGIADDFEDDRGDAFALSMGAGSASSTAAAGDASRSAEKSLFDNSGFSIDPEDDDIFGGGGGRSGGVGVVEGGGVAHDASASFLSALGDTGLSLDREEASNSAIDTGKEGMFEVKL